MPGILTEACFNKRADARPQDSAGRCEFIVGSYYLFESLLGLAGTLCDSLMLIRDGVVIANGPTDEVLTADNVRQVYGVEVDVIRHPSGHRVVVPVRRTPGAPRA